MGDGDQRVHTTRFAEYKSSENVENVVLERSTGTTPGHWKQRRVWSDSEPVEPGGKVNVERSESIVVGEECYHRQMIVTKMTVTRRSRWRDGAH